VANIDNIQGGQKVHIIQHIDAAVEDEMKRTSPKCPESSRE